MKKITPLFFIIAIIACNSKTVTETKNNLLWSESIQTILPLEKDTAWDGSNLTNASANFDEEKIFSSITKAVLSGKIKAYSDFPDKELTVDQVGRILVQWDSTATIEDPENSGTFVSAPIKCEIGAWNVPQINFHETIELDTITNVLSKKISYVTLYTFKRTEAGEAVGIKKLFDVKFND